MGDKFFKLRIFILLFIIPVIEIWLLIKVGNVIGPLQTLGALMVFSLIGVWLAKSQGFRIITAIRDELAVGRMPAAHFLDGVLILFGGILLIVPGFLTDFIGLFFLVPATRQLFKRWLRSLLERKLRNGNVVVIRR